MARSIVGSLIKVEKPKATEPLYKRLRSGYSVVDAKTQRVLGEIQPYLGKKIGDKKGWWMTYGADTYQAPTVGPLFVVAGALYRQRQKPVTKRLETPTDGGRRSLWRMVLAACSARLLDCVDPELRQKESKV